MGQPLSEGTTTMHDPSRCARALAFAVALIAAACGSKTALNTSVGRTESNSPRRSFRQGDSRPLVGAIRWDAWLPGNREYGWVSDPLYRRYRHRQPFYGWYTGDISDDVERDIVRKEIAYASAGGLDYWAFDWYPKQAEPQGRIQQAFEHYLALPDRGGVGFALLLQSKWLRYPASWSHYQSTYLPYFVELFADRDYVKVDGNRPLVFLFQSERIPPRRVDELREATTAAGFGLPYLVDVNMNVKSARRLGLDALSSYGPSGARLLNGRRHCWREQAARDERNWGPHTDLQTVVGLTPMADPRPREYGYWVDQPTRLDWRTHLRRAFAWIEANPSSVSNPPLLLIYSWNEIDEGGPGIVPTLQEGTRYLDDLRAVRSGDTSPYVDVLNGNHCEAVQTGSWTTDFPEEGIEGNRDGDEELATAPDSSLTVTADGTGFEWIGTRGPDRGQALVLVDGAESQTVDLYAPSVERRATLYRVTDLPAGSHRFEIRSLASKNPSSTGSLVGVDELRIHR